MVGESRPRLLVVDDEPAVLPIVERFARQLGFEVKYANGGNTALSVLKDFAPHVAMVDLRMPGLGGIDVLKAVRRSDPDCAVILMTGNASVDSAVEAVKSGALDYLSKPFDFDRLRGILTQVRDGLQRREALMQADARAAERLEFHGMIGRTPQMRQMFDTIQRLAPHVRTVLVTGETGTGKELVAKALHRAGRRGDKRFATVNCSAVVETLFESELFGHVRGAFTGATETKVGLFEHANGGTLFLDEVGELPLALQAKLLRAVEYGEVQRVGSLESRRADVCVIGATNRDLRAEVAAGRFRSDLFYRLSIIEVHIPPLRERREDIPYLTASFVRDCASRLERPIIGVTAQAERLLWEAPWPGNVRELRNVIERACILATDTVLGERDLLTAMAFHQTTAVVPTPMSMAMAPSEFRPTEPLAIPEDDSTTLSAAQREQIERALRETRGNKAAAAKRLGISRRSIYRWIERLGIDT